MNFFKENIRFLIDSNDYYLSALETTTGINKKMLDEFIEGREPSVQQLQALSRFTRITIDRLIKQNLVGIKTIRSDIKFLVLDVDGVMTDGGMYYSDEGDNMKKFNTKDGMGIKELCKKGFPVGIISASFSTKLVERRAKALSMDHVYIGNKPKLEVLKEWCKNMSIQLKNVAYIGDDINDLEIMEKVGLSACPNDAANCVKATANVILSHNGGAGCVRELIDNYIDMDIIKG